jgi:hypothetical protein
MAFCISGLSPEPFRKFFGLSEADLARAGVRRYVVDESPGFPDRIEMRDAAVGETMLLLNYVSMAEASPYRTTHAIFVREGAERAYSAIDEVPDVMRRRLQSLRAFDAAGMLLAADVATGDDIAPLIERLFADPAVTYIHAHNAKQGCYSGRIDRA